MAQQVTVPVLFGDGYASGQQCPACQQQPEVTAGQQLEHYLRAQTIHGIELCTCSVTHATTLKGLHCWVLSEPLPLQ